MDRMSKSKDINGEGKSQDKNQTKGENQGNSWPLRAAKGLGIAYLTMIGGSQGADGRPLLSESPGSALRGSDRLTSQTPPAFSDRQVRFTDNSLSDIHRLEDPKVRAKFEKDQKKWEENAPFHYPPPSDAQKTAGVNSKETPSSSEHFRSVPARDFESILQAAIRSRQGTPGEEISRLAADTPSHPREQDKNKERESRKLSKEEINSLKFLVDSLKKNPKALQGIQDVLKDKEVMEDIKNLMQDKEFRKGTLSELKDKTSVEQAILSLENPKALQDLKKVLNNKEYMEGIKNLMNNRSFRNRVLLEMKNKEIGKQNTSLQKNEQSHMSPAAAPNSLVIHDTSGSGFSWDSSGDSSGESSGDSSGDNGIPKGIGIGVAATVVGLAIGCGIAIYVRNKEEK